MKLFAIFGNPVSHSRSPQIHNALFESRNDHARYVRVLLPSGEMLKDRFEQLSLDGANITVPFKEDALSVCDDVRGIAQEIGAVNTIVKKEGKLIGYNTDAPGFLASIAHFSPRKILILGAGGTARALSIAFAQENIPFVVTNRSEGRLQFFSDKGYHTVLWENLKCDGFDMIINTTSAGLSDSELPLPEELMRKILKDAKVAVDCIYGKETPFLKMAHECALTCQDGALMLIYQAVLANALFMDEKYDNDEAFEIMKKNFFL
jgi:shikimate dehydrogenase